MLEQAKVPMYIKAPTPDRLVREMLKNNFRLGKAVRYFDIQKAGKEWYAWYLGNAEKLIRQQVNDGLTQNN